MKVKLVVVLLFVANLSFSQGSVPSLSGLVSFMSSTGQDYVSSSENEIQGSPFMIDAFTKGNLHVDGVWYEAIDLRYDIYNDRFEVKIEDAMYTCNSSESNVDTIIYKAEVFIRKTRDVALGTTVTYMSLLMEKDDVSLCKKYNVRLSEAKPPAGYSDPEPAEYKRLAPSYFIFQGQKSTEIKNVKSLAEIFSRDVKEVKKFLKENKYKLSKEEDLMKACHNYMTSDD